MAFDLVVDFGAAGAAGAFGAVLGWFGSVSTGIGSILSEFGAEISGFRALFSSVGASTGLPVIYKENLSAISKINRNRMLTIVDIMLSLHYIQL